MKAILIEISWSRSNLIKEFREITEIAAIQLDVIDGMTVSEGTFHSYIRPTYHLWKKNKTGDSLYSDWWLAPTFPQVMENFSEWNHPISEQPWIIWNNDLLNVWKMNSERHNYPPLWPKGVIHLHEEIKKRNLPFFYESSSKSAKTPNNNTAEEKVMSLSQLISRKVLLQDLPVKTFVVPTEPKSKSQDPSVRRLIKLLERDETTIEEITDWSGLSFTQVKSILLLNRPLNRFQKERLNQAWTMWESVQELKGKWGKL